MPKLSIITVNLNNKSGLIDTAKSVVAQTWTDYEWLVIDGGSTDGSVDVIREYADKTDKLVYWCSEPDGGIYQGMNKGIEKAGGEYCWFLNSGDYAYKNTTLEEIFANEFDEDIVYGDMIMKKRNQKHYIWKFRKKIYLTDLIYGFLPHNCMFIKTKVLVAKNGYRTDYKIVSDWAFYIEAICRQKISYKHISIIFAIIQEGGISTNREFYNIQKQERKKVINELFSKKQQIFYFFSFASLRNKIHKIRYCIEKYISIFGEE